MADRAMDVYLNDHLAGAMLGSDLAQWLLAHNEGTALGELMRSLAPQIEQDRQTLIGLMERIGSSRNPVKQGMTWVAEKASRAKFSGLTSGDTKLGTLMAIEALVLGVHGKECMWKALKEAADQHAPLSSMKLDELIERAQAQHSALERQRLAHGRLVLGSTDRIDPMSRTRRRRLRKLMGRWAGDRPRSLGGGA